MLELKGTLINALLQIRNPEPSKFPNLYFTTGCFSCNGSDERESCYHQRTFEKSNFMLRRHIIGNCH